MKVRIPGCPGRDRPDRGGMRRSHRIAVGETAAVGGAAAVDSGIGGPVDRPVGGRRTDHAARLAHLGLPAEHPPGRASAPATRS